MDLRDRFKKKKSAVCLKEPTPQLLQLLGLDEDEAL